MPPLPNVPPTGDAGLQTARHSTTEGADSNSSAKVTVAVMGGSDPEDTALW